METALIDPTMKALLIFLLAGGLCNAAEPLRLPLELGTFTTLDNKTYEGTKVIGRDAVGIRISHNGGTARIPFQRLRPEFAAKFHFDREAAAQQLENEAADAAAHERDVQMALDARRRVAAMDGGKIDESFRDDGGVPQELVVEEPPVLTEAQLAQRIASMQRYIARLKAGIVDTEKDIERWLERADRIAASAFTQQLTSRGIMRADLNRSRLNRARDIRDRANREKESIKEARLLIKETEAQIREMERLQSGASAG